MKKHRKKKVSADDITWPEFDWANAKWIGIWIEGEYPRIFDHPLTEEEVIEKINATQGH
jgi:hypothetical protein